MFGCLGWGLCASTGGILFGIDPSYVFWMGSAAALLLMLGASFFLELMSVLVPAANQILIDHIITPGRETWLWPVLVGLAVVVLDLYAGW